MKKAVIILSVLLFCTTMMLGWKIYADFRYEQILVSSASHFKTSTSYIAFDTIEELRKGWPTAPIEEWGISPECAMKLGVAYLKQEFGQEEKSMFDQIFRTKYSIAESKDGTYYIVTMLVKGETDFDVAIDKKNGTLLHRWAGE